ncbi:FAD-dependent monooxygenase [Polyangium sp. 15x6]|uniref:FAD-dependent monooxygenase n=1 Tax=Polyangium sp. 15x6 TaxID=3042687 RepID=UPI00249B766B|nr:FAD-dependent monooxygenase [Polyangium sp. 15x6]MDI3287007.1 FAD-dependent monooxygenase [Polyangium sp. 15x6]
MSETDVIIVGQGIAGVSLSLLLERQGVAHTLLGRKGGGKGFALAETLPPSALPLLSRLDLLEVFEAAAIQRTHGYHSVWGRDVVTDNNFFFHRGFQHGLKIDKQALSATLLGRQAAHVVWFEKLLSVSCDGPEVAVTFRHDERTHRISGKLLVDATGRQRAVLRRLGIRTQDFDSLTAFSCHVPRVDHPALPHGVLIEAFEAGWGIVSRLNERENVFTLFTRTAGANEVAGQDALLAPLHKYANWHRHLSETKFLRHFLSGDGATKVLGAKANSSKAHTMAGRHWLALGDAALSFDPLSSHGITNAVYTAQLAASTIVAARSGGGEGALREYEATLTAIFMQYLQSKDQLYRQERRWPHAAFWRV